MQESVTCPHGCEAFDAQQWSFVSAAENPELKDAVFGGELNLLRCPQCGSFFYADTDFIYLDEDAQLLVFVFAEKNRANKDALLAKMKQDYAQLKDTLLKQVKLDFGPICVFGPGELKEVMEKEQKRIDESQAIAAAAAVQGLKVARLKPEWAREKDFPLYTAAGADETARSYADSARKVLESGLQSPLLKHFAEEMEGEGAAAPDVYYDTEKT